ncbi:MAG: hypothetical protein ACRDGI_04980 [Candidatus Limnocylindrales bacterium]
MPNMRGFLHSKPKIDEGEWALAESRSVARLAGMFGDMALDEDEADDQLELESADGDLDPADEPAELEAIDEGSAERVAGPRPPIIVVGTSAKVAARGVSPIGVMARDGDDVGDDSWQLPLSRPTLVPMRPRKVAATASPAPTSGGRASNRPARSRAKVPPAPPVHCPYCAAPLEPPPTTSRRCEECRQRIVVKRVDGRQVYLTEAALPVFESERRRVASSARLTRERDRWLGLADGVGGSTHRHAQISAARLTDVSVAAARAFYLAAAERAFRLARRDKKWDLAARIRRDEAVAVHRAEGSPKPPSPEVLALYRDGVASELRGIADISRDAELVAAACCDACRADDKVLIRITSELRQPRLPHVECPKGLCRCHWDLATRDRTTMRRYLRRRPATDARPSSTGPASAG